MLQIKDITKKYITGNLQQMALDGVSLDLRDNEFVAILGPSGSGKTTLLNIIGGLDRYDTGDLIINGTTTKRYKDRDWDSYRNHTIGFVFQSYNLIPHQNVLSNVELALTIGGISRSERTRRAKEALVKVGLEDHIYKKPNQLSGGQMQRVAIARALVNDPDILLADEPTGALDSETSLQVMDLLKEVAKDRLVVMVTHNPELAEKYATRIVNLKDGKIIGDSNPFDASLAMGEPVHRNLGKASMSFLTALALSFNNLWTKKTRTVLVAFAGSIGIIGIALILALSNGVNQYIEDTERETLSEYPLQIQKTSFDFTSFLGYAPTEVDEEYQDAEVRERKMVGEMFSKIEANDLSSLKTYLDSPESHIMDYSKAVEYGYNITPWIYRIEGEKLWQVCPDSTMAAYAGDQELYSMMGISFSYFNRLPTDPKLYKSQYDVVAGRWPEKASDAVVVLMTRHDITDYLLYTLGLKDMTEFEDMVKRFSNGENMQVKDEEPGTYEYKDLEGINFKVVPAFRRYSYDERYKVWTDKGDNKEFIRELAENGLDLNIVGVVVPAEDAKASMLQPGIAYTEELVLELIKLAGESEIVKQQMASPKKNVLSGKDFSDESDNAFDMGEMFTVDEEAFANAFSFDGDMSGFSMPNLDLSSLSNMDLSNLSNMNMGDFVDPSSLMGNTSMPELTEDDYAKLFDGVEINVTEDQLSKIFSDVAAGYQKAAPKDVEAISEEMNNYVQGYFQSEAFNKIIQDEIENLIKNIEMPTPSQEEMAAMFQRIMSGFGSYMARYNPTSGISLDEYAQGYFALPETQQVIAEELGKLNDPSKIVIPTIDTSTLMPKIMTGFQQYMAENPDTGLSTLLDSFQKYINTEDGRKTLQKSIQKNMDTSKMEKKFNENASKLMSEYMGKVGAELSKNLEKSISNAMQAAMEGYSEAISTAMTSAMGEFGTQFSEAMADQLGDAFSFDEEALKDAFKFNMTSQELEELMTSLMRREGNSYDNNLKNFGYADLLDPNMINIYPIDFESKDGITKILDQYNKDMEDSGNEEKVVKYSDIVGTLMSSVTDIINSISYVLIAFVAISLVVSSIMIGVITYISVLERRKEIGILRAIGASKRNISGVFNAETFIIGLLAGLFGVGLANLLLIPGNKILHAIAENDSINAVIPASAAVILVVLSVILTLIGGLIPSRKAAKSDPVTALRTE